MSLGYFNGEWNNRKKNDEHRATFSTLGPNIVLYDLGSTGGTPPPFCYFLEGLDLVNFEPDYRGESEGSGRTLPVAIGPVGLNTIYLNRRPTTSSLLRPYAEVVDRYDFERTFPGEGDIFETLSTMEVKTVGLDEAVKEFDIPPADFLKIDVQGLSLEVLETGSEMLSNSLLGVQIEVEFLQTYVGQKTMGGIHEFMYSRGFEIFEVSNLNRWYHKTKIPLKKWRGQDVFCDLLYLRSLSTVEANSTFWTERKAIQFLRICLLYDLNDTSAAFLEKFYEHKILNEQKFNQFYAVISHWWHAVDYFYDKPKNSDPDAQTFRNTLLDFNIRTLIRKIRTLKARLFQ